MYQSTFGEAKFTVLYLAHKMPYEDNPHPLIIIKQRFKTWVQLKKLDDGTSQGVPVKNRPTKSEGTNSGRGEFQNKSTPIRLKPRRSDLL